MPRWPRHRNGRKDQPKHSKATASRLRLCLTPRPPRRLRRRRRQTRRHNPKVKRLPNPTTRHQRRQLGTLRTLVHLPPQPTVARVRRPIQAPQARRPIAPTAVSTRSGPSAGSDTPARTTGANASARTAGANASAQTAGANASAQAAGANTPAGTKGSNPKANANTTSNILTATGGDVAPKSTQNVPPNANAASGGKRQAIATTTATTTTTTNKTTNGAVTATVTTNNSGTPAPVNANPATVQRTSPPASVTKTSSTGGKSNDSKDSDATDATVATRNRRPRRPRRRRQPIQRNRWRRRSPSALRKTLRPRRSTALTANLTVGDQTKTRPKLTLTAQAANQDTSAPQDTTDAGTAKETPSTTQFDNPTSARRAQPKKRPKAKARRPFRQQQRYTSGQRRDHDGADARPGIREFRIVRRRRSAQTSPASTSENAASVPTAQGHESAKSNGIDGLPNFDFSVSPQRRHRRPRLPRLPALLPPGSVRSPASQSRSPLERRRAPTNSTSVSRLRNSVASTCSSTSMAMAR